MTTFHGLYSNSPPTCLEHRTFLYTAQQKLIVSLSPSFLHEDNQYEECWASQTCHQLQFYLLVNLQRVNSSGEILNNIFTYIDKINYRRAILFLNIDFKKGMHEFLDKQTRTSIMQFTLTLSEIRRKKKGISEGGNLLIKANNTSQYMCKVLDNLPQITAVFIGSQKWWSVTKAAYEVMSWIMWVNQCYFNKSHGGNFKPLLF